MSNILALFLIFLLFVVQDVFGCDITATLTSQTYHEVFAQFTFHNQTKSPVYQFEKDGSEKKVHITGMWCNMKPTKLDIYRKVPSGQKPTATTQAFIEGFGFMNYVLLSDGVFMGAKAGVACAVGDCGNSRG
ncbi:unnamed protein product [Caenorhabditis sp. 36 PRJEB53466]|nr:unnamed protein product [Caenorhabditis sp. 36 PRJEB53466]